MFPLFLVHITIGLVTLTPYPDMKSCAIAASESNRVTQSQEYSCLTTNEKFPRYVSYNWEDK